MNSNKLVGNYILSVVNSALSLLFPIITFPYVTRVLGSTNLGIVNFAQSYGYYFIQLASFGISSYAVREISKVRDNPTVLEKKANEIFNLNFLFSVVSWVLYILIVLAVPKFRENLVVMLVYSLIVLTNYLTVDWLLQSFDDYFFSTMRSTVVRVLSLAAVFLFVKQQEDYVIYMLISTLAEMGARISATKYSRIKYVKLKYRSKYLNFKDHIKPLFSLFSFRLVNGISSQLDKLMIGFMMLYSDVGVYSAGVKIVFLLIPLVENVGLVLFPTLNIAANNSRKKYEEGLKFNYDVILMLAMPMAVGLFLVSPMIIKIFAGKEFLNAISISRIMAPVILLCPIGDLLGSKTLLIFDKNKQLLISSSIVVVANVVLNSCFIPILGADGAAIASLISYVVAIVCRLYYTNKIVKFNLFTKETLKYFVYTVPFIIVYLLFKSFVDTNVICFIVFMVFCALVYFAELIIFKDKILLLIVNKIRPKGQTNEVE